MTLSEQAYANLEELIVTLKLAPGRIVSEGELSVLTGIGRTPIREALQRLAREKLVSIPVAIVANNAVMTRIHSDGKAKYSSAVMFRITWLLSSRCSRHEGFDSWS